MAILRLDPAPTDVQYELWSRTAKGPATWGGIGARTGPIRRRSARLSRLMTAASGSGPSGCR